MEMDLSKNAYNQEGYEEYILGSAEVVGLMCLKVFCDGDEQRYQDLKGDAMRLGSAFQKVNFLRDLKADYQQLGRSYFPGVDIDRFDDLSKKAIEEDIRSDFDAGLRGILRLPKSARFGVYLSYVYFRALFEKIQSTPSKHIMEQRIRIPNNRKIGLLVRSYVRHSINLL